MPFDLEVHARTIERDGYTIIEDFLDAARLSEVRRVLGLYLGSHSGRNPFEGFNTERVYTLVARGRVFWDIVLDARVLALCDRFLLPNCLLTASQAICIRPGEQPQDLHHDDTFYTVPRPRPMISISTIAAGPTIPRPRALPFPTSIASPGRGSRRISCSAYRPRWRAGCRSACSRCSATRFTRHLWVS